MSCQAGQAGQADRPGGVRKEKSQQTKAEVIMAQTEADQAGGVRKKTNQQTNAEVVIAQTERKKLKKMRKVILTLRAQKDPRPKSISTASGTMITSLFTFAPCV